MVCWNWKSDGFALLLISGMFIAGAALLPHLPERVPVHWDIHGQPDRYGSPWEATFAIPGLAALIFALMHLLPRIDPRSANYARFAGVYTLFRLAIVVFLSAMQGVILANAMGVRVRVAQVVMIAIGVLFVLSGNYLGKVQPNWFVGIRTPWTLTSTRSWRKTHRLGGYLFVASGLLFIACAFVGDGLAGAILPLAFLGMSTLWLVVYSYLVWRADPERETASGRAA